MFADEITRQSLSSPTVIYLIIKNGSFLDFFKNIIFSNLIILHLEKFLFQIRLFTLTREEFLNIYDNFYIIKDILHIAEHHTTVAIVKIILSPVESLLYVLYNIRVHVQYTCTNLICIKYCILDKLSKIIRVKHNDYK